MLLCIFEDNLVGNFYPLVYLRPVYALRCGALSLRQKILSHFSQTHVAFHVRSYLLDCLRERFPENSVNEIAADRCFLVNGRILADSHLAKQVPTKWKEDLLFVDGETPVAAWVSGNRLEYLKRKMGGGTLGIADFDGLPRREVEARLLQYPWDLLSANAREIVSDVAMMTKRSKRKIQGKVHPGVHLINRREIFVGKRSSIKPGAVLDAEHGPIYIGDEVQIHPNAVIEGPAFIGRGSVVKIGAKIYESTSIGEVCKVGGEIEGSIVHAFANKQHDGFLGHSYICPWVNLGADTNNSDLKNNYSSVRVYLNGKLFDSGQLSVGLFMGDHSKSGINSMFDTGTVVGVSCNIYGAGAPSKFVPSFSWGGSEKLVEYRLSKSIDVAQKVMERRSVRFTAAYGDAFRAVFDLTAGERYRLRVHRENS
ncbi:MAG: putative sugar nucleotidyl transferase [Bacteroidota bacterium]